MTQNKRHKKARGKRTKCGMAKKAGYVGRQVIREARLQRLARVLHKLYSRLGREASELSV